MRLRVDGEGPLVIKLGGAAGGVELFREEMDGAVEAGYRVAALDTSGDRSDDPAPSPLTWELFLREIEEALESLGEDRAILWGTSFGCNVALAAASRIPRRVTGLLLSFPPEQGYRRPLFSALLRRVERSRRPEALFRPLFMILFGGLTVWEFAVPTALLRSGTVLRAGLEAATPTTTVMRKLNLLWGDDPNAGAGPPVQPTRIIAGSWDPVAPPGGAARLAARIPGARLDIIPMAGHSAHYSRPRTYRRLYLDALRELSCGARRRNATSGSPRV